MARQKLSEYRTKVLLHNQLGMTYEGVQITPHFSFDPAQLDTSKSWVLKVDQGIKKRGKQGLVRVGIHVDDIQHIVDEWVKNGYEYFLVEPMIRHAENDERYISIQRTSDGILLICNRHGGVDIEDHGDSTISYLLDEAHFDPITETTKIPTDILRQFILFFNRHHFSFLEINPHIIADNNFIALDAAAYVDSAAHFLAAGSWDENDFRRYNTRKQTDEEIFVQQLASSSQASFKYEIINPDGAIFMLLSGGGASVVLADEVFNRGAGSQLANYGEYSGNPNREETFLYTSAILRSLLLSSADDKKLIIAGGIANFTDIRATFDGIIQALNEHASKLREQNVKIYIRRGGPHEAEALETMKTFLETNDLFGSIGGHDVIITSAVERALTGPTT